MPLWKFKCNVAAGITECHINYRGFLEDTGAIGFNAYTRNFDDAIAADAECIKVLEIHKSDPLLTGTATLTFTKEAAVQGCTGVYN